MKKITFSIVIIDYKAEKLLPNCIDSIKKHIHTPYEIIIIDNNRNNRGFSKAANIGAKKACGKYLFFLNPDTVVEKGDFKKLARYLDKHTDIGILGLKMVLTDNSLQPYSFEHKYSLLGAMRQKIGIGKTITKSNLDWVSGGAMIIRKDLFHKLGGFDEQFFMYFEDQDLCLRAKDLNYKVNLWENITITHLGGVPKTGGLHGNIDKQVKMYKKSQLLFIKKHYNSIYLIIFKYLRSLYP